MPPILVYSPDNGSATRARRRPSAPGPAVLDIHGGSERPSTHTITIGTLTVTFDVRYATGEEGERVAARQAEAIAALARWAAHPRSSDTEEQADRE